MYKNLDTAQISVICEKIEDNRMNINIAFPKEQGGLTVNSSVMLLASGINLLIRSCPEANTGVKEYDLLKDVINYMESEFTNPDSFDDIMFKKNRFKTKE